MEKQSKMATPIIPDNLVVFICGVPGMGKTTISYELLKKLNNPGGNPSPVRRMEITNPFCWKSRFR